MVSFTIFEHTNRHLKSSNQYNLYSQRLCKSNSTHNRCITFKLQFIFLPDRRENNSLNSTIVQQELLNGTRNLTQQDIQTPSHFINELIIETVVTTTKQSISPIHPNLTTPRPKNPLLLQVILQSTVKPSVASKYLHMDYQTYRPMTKPSQKRKTFTRINFAEHNYNFVNPSQTTHSPRKSTQNHLFLQKNKIFKRHHQTQ